MRAIDADVLIADLKYDVYLDANDLLYEELTDERREIIQFDKDCKQNAIDMLDNAPTIKTKEIKYFDEDEKVWKIGSVIVDENVE
jgi:hypothetical protein